MTLLLARNEMEGKGDEPRAKTKVKRAENRLARSEEMAEWKQSLIRRRSERGYGSIFLSDFFWKTKRNKQRKTTAKANGKETKEMNFGWDFA